MSQHPAEHDVPSQTHLLSRHRCPTAQGPPVPHMHCPFTHMSATPGSQAMHMVPLVEHALMENGVHVELASQQPPGQDVASHWHCPLEQY